MPPLLWLEVVPVKTERLPERAGTATVVTMVMYDG